MFSDGKDRIITYRIMKDAGKMIWNKMMKRVRQDNDEQDNESELPEVVLLRLSPI